MYACIQTKFIHFLLINTLFFTRKFNLKCRREESVSSICRKMTSNFFAFPSSAPHTGAASELYRKKLINYQTPECDFIMEAEK